MTGEKIVLHVEDNSDNRMLVRRLLESCGYQVLDAGNAEKAREVLKANRPNLILMDINMPDEDGYALTHQIKNMPEQAGVPIVAITANVMKGDRERALSAGCDGYIEKPIDIDQFLTQIEQFAR